MELAAVIAFLAAAVVLWWTYGRGEGLDGDVLTKTLESGATVLDVRSPGEFAAGHVRGALNVPVDQLGLRLSELGEPGAEAIVVYCASGMRSRRARSILQSVGFTVVDAGRLSAFAPELRT